MKKILLPVLCLLILAGCTQAPSSPAHTEPTKKPTIYISSQISTLSAEDGTELFRQKSPEILLTLQDPAATQAISKELSQVPAQWTGDLAQVKEFITETYQTGDDWELWFCHIEAQAMRLDEKVVSIYFSCEKFLGGNHPTSLLDCVTYDCNTAQRLQLEDLLAPGHGISELAAPVNEALAARKELLYDDYEALVSQMFMNHGVKGWYLSENQLCFVFAPYAIGPYASGIITVAVPYEKLNGILLAEYL